MDLSQNSSPKGEAVIAVSSSYMWCFIFMERKRASNFRAVLPGCSRAKPKPPVILLRPLNCNVPSLSFKVSISSFSRKLRLVFRGNIFYHGLNGIGYASSTRSGIRCCKKTLCQYHTFAYGIF